MQKRLETNYRSIDEEADLVFTVSKKLLERFPKQQKKLWVPNGVDVARFTAQPEPQRENTRPRAVYLGVIQQRVDLHLLGWLAQQLPGVDFLLTGDVWQGIDLSPLRHRSNIQMLGFVPTKKVPELLAGCAVGLVPHRRTALTESMNPMKIYEYLAADLPVVTTIGEGFEDMKAAVATAHSPGAFLHAVQNMLRRKSEPGSVRALVAQHTWSTRFALMQKAIEGSLQDSDRERNTV